MVRLAGITLGIFLYRKREIFPFYVTKYRQKYRQINLRVLFFIGVRFGPKRDGLAVLVFGNEVVYCVLGDVWWRGNSRWLGLHAAILACITASMRM